MWLSLHVFRVERPTDRNEHFIAQCRNLTTLAEQPCGKNIVAKGENAIYQHSLLFPPCFPPYCTACNYLSNIEIFVWTLFKWHLLKDGLFLSFLCRENG